MGKLIYLLSASLLLGLPAVAKDKKHKDKESNEKVEAKVQAATEERRELRVGVSISAAERESIQKFMTVSAKQPTFTTPVVNNSKSLPPGLAKKAARGKSLPPGWQKKLQSGEVMPVEVFHECKPLPRELIVKLPPQPKGVITVTVEGKVVRLLEATREILDVFDVLGK